MANKGKTNIYLIKTSLRKEWSLTQLVGLVLEEAVACCGHDVRRYRAVAELGQDCSGKR